MDKHQLETGTGLYGILLSSKHCLISEVMLSLRLLILVAILPVNVLIELLTVMALS